MIRRLLLVPVLLFACASALADEDYSWCQGFVAKALGEFPVEGLSRINLWLDWSEIVEETVVNKSLNRERYQAGRDRFSQLNAQGNSRAIVDIAEDDCAVGRNPLWAWW